MERTTIAFQRTAISLRSSVVLCLILTALSGSHSAKADSLGAESAGLLLENTFPDLDVEMLTDFAGFSSGSLTYGANITSTSFTAYLSGTYAGEPLHVTYAGNLASFPGGAITWTSTGDYGAEAWSGSGSAVFTFPDASSFDEMYSSSMTLGSHSGSYSATLEGSTTPFVEYLNGSGTMIADGVADQKTPTATDPEHPTGEELTSDDICRHGKIDRGYCTGKGSSEDIVSADAVYSGPPDVVDRGTMYVLPEPSYGLFCFAAVGLFVAARIRSLFGRDRLRSQPRG